MLGFFLRRLAMALAVIFSVSLVAFCLLNLAGDVAIALAGPNAGPADIQAIRERYGLNRPLTTQYLEWLGRAVQGDLGNSIYFQLPVAQVIGERIGITLQLGVMGLLFAICLAVPLGVLAGSRPNSWLDRAALALALVGQAIPSFWLALLMILFFGVYLKLLPISGSGTLLHFVMPMIVLGYYATPAIMRLTRAGMIDVLQSDYVRTAYAKGLPARTVIFKHALRNAIIPVVALAAVQFGLMLGGSIIIETVFSLQGVGFLAWQSISRSDFPVVQGVVLLLSLIFIVLVLLTDIITARLDPRLRKP